MFVCDGRPFGADFERPGAAIHSRMQEVHFARSVQNRAMPLVDVLPKKEYRFVTSAVERPERVVRYPAVAKDMRKKFLSSLISRKPFGEQVQSEFIAIDAILKEGNRCRDYADD